MQETFRWVLDRETKWLEENDPRKEDYAKYKAEHGFSPDELWDLDTTIAAFALPRMRAFRDRCPDRLIPDLDKAIEAFRIVVEEPGYPWIDKKQSKLFRDGLKAFSRIFGGRWY